MRQYRDKEILANIKSNLPILEELLVKVSSNWSYEDSIYRLYHTSFKVYHLQAETIRIVDALKTILPNAELNKMFVEIISDGIHKTFDLSHNKEWLKHTRPICEAFFHAKYMLEMAVKYGKELDEAPTSLPSGWASLLYLFNER